MNRDKVDVGQLSWKKKYLACSFINQWRDLLRGKIINLTLIKIKSLHNSRLRKDFNG